MRFTTKLLRFLKTARSKIDDHIEMVEYFLPDESFSGLFKFLNFTSGDSLRMEMNHLRYHLRRLGDYLDRADEAENAEVRDLCITSAMRCLNAAMNDVDERIHKI